MDTSPPSPDLPLEYGESDHTPPARSTTNTLRLATGGAIAALVAVVGFIAVTQIGSASDGADSPEAAVQALADAVNAEDLDAVRAALTPGERDALADPIRDLLGELGRVDILSDNIDTTAIPGLDLELIDLSMAPTSIADDLAVVRVTGTLRATFFGRELPLGQALIETSADTGLDIENVPSPPPAQLELNLATVRQNGGWYVSIAYTIAEIQRTENGWPLPNPAEAIEPQGAESPDALIEAFVSAAEGLDVAALIAQLNPGEAEAAQRYAPNYLENAASSMAEGNTTIDISDLEYRIEQDGNWADVHIDRMTLVTTNHDGWMGEITSTVRYADGCMNTLTTYDDEYESDQYDNGEMGEEWLPPGYTIEDDGSMTICPVAGSPSASIGLLWGSSAPPTLGLANHDGRWYISPTRTIANQLLASLRQIDDGAGAEFIWGMFGGSTAFGDSGDETFSEIESTIDIESAEEITSDRMDATSSTVTDTTVTEESERTVTIVPDE